MKGTRAFALLATTGGLLLAGPATGASAQEECQTLADCVQQRVNEAPGTVQQKVTETQATVNQTIATVQQTAQPYINQVFTIAGQTLATVQQAAQPYVDLATQTLAGVQQDVAELRAEVEARVADIAATPARLQNGIQLVCAVQGRLDADANSDGTGDVGGRSDCVEIKLTPGQPASVRQVSGEFHMHDYDRTGNTWPLCARDDDPNSSHVILEGKFYEFDVQRGDWYTDDRRDQAHQPYRQVLTWLPAEPFETLSPPQTDCDGDMFVNGVVSLLST